MVPSTNVFFIAITLFGVLSLVVKSDEDCDAPIIPAKKNGIEGRYIVVMKDDATDLEAENFRKVMEISGANIKHEYKGRGHAFGRNRSKFNGFAIKLVDGKKRAATLRKAKKNCAVKYIEQDQYARISACSTQLNAGWCLSKISQQSSKYIYPWSAGNGAIIYVIDTGCNETHPDLVGRISYKKNFCSSEPSNYDLNGHGTATASCCVGKSCGAAKNAKVVCLKAMNAQGTGTYSDIIKAVDYVTGIRTDKGIISMSLGGGYSAAMNKAVESAYASGHLPIVAAGNENQDASNVSPASSPNAITVAASDQNNKMASFTNYGKFIDIIAPGVSCNAARAQNNGFSSVSGTSIATPYCSGIAAVIQRQLGLLSDSAAPKKITIAMLNAAKNGLIGSMKPSTVNKLLFWNNCN